MVIADHPSALQVFHSLEGEAFMRFARKKRSSLAIELLEDRTVPATLSILADINASNPSSDPREFTQVGDSLYFSAKTEATGFEIWRTDGTVEGTNLVKDIYPGAASSSPHNLKSINGKLYFTANDGINGYELWQSDGSEEGTNRISNFSATAFFSHESPVILLPLFSSGPWHCWAIH